MKSSSKVFNGLNNSTAKTNNKMKKNNKYFKKKFADFLSAFDDESYEVHYEKKTELFAGLHGRVLEIGPGTGVNFPFLEGKSIEWMGIEPNHEMHPYLFENAKNSHFDIKLLDCSSESICLPSNNVDYIISSEVLCSVEDLNKTLLEIRRVLKPGGKFLFLEHVVDKKNIFRKMVQLLVPFTPWKLYSDGCNPGRDIGGAIGKSGFSEVNYTDYMREGSGIIITINRPHIYGWAIK